MSSLGRRGVLPESWAPSQSFLVKTRTGALLKVVMEKFPMTPRGAKLVETELAALKKERPRISKEIGTAIEHGDLSENAEYDTAKR